jgi:hypothetical protein
MKIMKAMLLCWSVILLVTAAEAQLQKGLRLGSPDYGGSGCPAGTASVSVSPSEDAISVLFDQFTVEAGSSSMRRVDRKSCDLSIPVQVPQGYSVAIVQTDFRGFNLVPSYGGMNRLNTEYFWAGIRGPMYSRLFTGPQNADYTETNGVMATSLVWAPCGASVNLRIRATIMTQTNSRMDQSMMTVDSADVSSGLLYHLQWRRCQ